MKTKIRKIVGQFQPQSMQLVRDITRYEGTFGMFVCAETDFFFFVGKNCDEDIFDCKENSCPPSATCVDLTGKFYCQCPFNLTGDDCRKSEYAVSGRRLDSALCCCLVSCCRISRHVMIFVICISAIQVDYDLYFSDPTRSSASLVVPFFLGAKSSLTIAMWVQFTQKDEGGIFFSLYSVSYVDNLFCTLVFPTQGSTQCH